MIDFYWFIRFGKNDKQMTEELFLKKLKESDVVDISRKYYSKHDPITEKEMKNLILTISTSSILSLNFGSKFKIKNSILDHEMKSNISNILIEYLYEDRNIIDLNLSRKSYEQKN